MKRLGVFTFGILLLFSSSNLLAQDRGRHSGGAPSGGANDTSITDFKIALAIQATPDQIAQFQSLSKGTETAEKQAQELHEQAGQASTSADFTRPAVALKNAVDQALSDNRTFLQSFSKFQKSQLKELTKKLDKASSDVAKEGKGLEQLLKSSKPETPELAGVSDRLQKALAEFHARQVNLGDEMGIQTQSR